jgi:hypothetical protein
LLNHNGEPNPAQSDLAPDAAWQNTSARIVDARKKLRGTKLDTEASLSLLDALRTANPSEAVDLTSEMLSSGISTHSISDALFLSAGEMLRQQPGIISLHSATTTNAMQYAFQTTYRDSTRLELLLQNAAFIPHFRESMKSRGDINEQRIDNHIVRQEVDSSEADQLPSVEMIFAQISDSRDGAALTMQNFLDAGGEPESLMNEARRLVFLKGTDSHDYKFSSAALEDFYAVSPALRNAYLASAAYLLPGSKDRDNGLMEKVQDALVG